MDRGVVLAHLEVAERYVDTGGRYIADYGRPSMHVPAADPIPRPPRTYSATLRRPRRSSSPIETGF